MQMRQIQAPFEEILSISVGDETFEAIEPGIFELPEEAAKHFLGQRGWRERNGSDEPLPNLEAKPLPVEQYVHPLHKHIDAIDHETVLMHAHSNSDMEHHHPDLNLDRAAGPSKSLMGEIMRKDAHHHVQGIEISEANPQGLLLVSHEHGEFETTHDHPDENMGVVLDPHSHPDANDSQMMTAHVHLGGHKEHDHPDQNLLNRPPAAE